ncbi:MAG: yyaL [Chlamydiales bacterium]|jgi:uncharacterized protein YyaL (SSP411 family)|nr:yyaL [Chlamydiales bacterium]
MNQLTQEKSPHLERHAASPIAWRPWGEAAFLLAKQLDRPIFLSIGYASCHYCHVMERESFSDALIASHLNENFINIKVDRQELPEIDLFYMEISQLMLEQGPGWPLNLFLTPTLHPFLAFTYIPPYSINETSGFIAVIERVKAMWDDCEVRDRLIGEAEKRVQLFQKHVSLSGETLPSKDLLKEAAALFYRRADAQFGGFSGAPKFPQSYHALFLLAHSYRAADSRALFLAEKNLAMVFRGGIYDQIGGGISRYSVDEKWSVPSFEKMLLDNALFLESAQTLLLATKKPLYRQIMEEVSEYILRDMTHLLGAFCAAEDADSEGKEGAFYTWDYEEVISLLGEKQGSLLAEFYGVRPRGSFQGKNILQVAIPLEEFARKKNSALQPLADSLKAGRQALFQERQKRERPLRDDLILTSANSLMIHSLALASAASGRGDYWQAALKAAEFIEHFLIVDGALYRRWRLFEVRHEANLEEYAFAIRAWLTLFEVGGDAKHLKLALTLNEQVERGFKKVGGAFYQTKERLHPFFGRKCHFSDGAEPSGNSVHAENLLRLYRMTLEERFLKQAKDIFKGAHPYLLKHPVGYGYLCYSLERYCQEGPLLVVALAEEDQREEVARLIGQSFLPFKSLIWRRATDPSIDALLPVHSHLKPIGQEATLYVQQKINGDWQVASGMPAIAALIGRLSVSS